MSNVHTWFDCERLVQQALLCAYAKASERYSVPYFLEPNMDTVIQLEARTPDSATASSEDVLVSCLCQPQPESMLCLDHWLILVQSRLNLLDGGSPEGLSESNNISN